MAATCCEMTALDIIILVFVAVGLATGLYKGFISQLGSIAAIVLGIIACRLWGDVAVGVVSGWLDPSPEYSSWTVYGVTIIGYVLLFVVVYLAVIVLARLLHRLSHVMLMGPIDHIAGALLGIFKWVLLLSVLVNLWLVCSPGSKAVEDSRLAGGKVAAWVKGFAPSLLGACVSGHGSEPCNNN